MIQIYFKQIVDDTGLSIYRIGKLTGLSAPTLHKIYKGNTKGIDFDVLNKLCKGLNKRVDDILRYVP